MLINANIAALILACSAVVSAAPTDDNVIFRRAASASDTCEVGYCTLNGGTTGGAGSKTITVTSIDELADAAGADGPSIIIVDGKLSGADRIRVKSDKTIIGKSGASMTGVGFYVKKVSNVIIRNLKISKVLATNGDGITVQDSKNVWVDHCDLSSDMDHGKDHYDGLLDITHASEYVTVSNTHFHDHFKASLVGHSDNNGDEDTGHLHVTYANNHWENVNSREPSVRFGTVHIVNSYYDDCHDGINARMGAQLLVESTAFGNCGKDVIVAEYSKKPGYVVTNDVDLGGSANTAPKGDLSTSDLGYKVSLLGSHSVKSAVVGKAGNTLRI